MNDRLLSGPTLQNQLAQVLNRFRRNQYAVTADVETVFSRIRISDKDAWFQRFWWSDTPVGKPEVYEMTRLMLGAKCRREHTGRTPIGEATGFGGAVWDGVTWRVRPDTAGTRCPETESGNESAKVSSHSTRVYT